MNNKKITIIDYGLGNLYSISKAIECYSSNVIISDKSDDILSADAVVLPGVGAFAAGMDGLRKKQLIEIIINYANLNKPILGICLGAQLLLEKGYEFGEYGGLGIIPGSVEIFPDSVAKLDKIPHIGWNGILEPEKKAWKKTILEDIDNDANVYFVHSYIMKPIQNDNILSLTEYGGQKFCSAVKKGNIYGVQFHPEKSGEIGLKIIKNFINNT